MKATLIAKPKKRFDPITFALNNKTLLILLILCIIAGCLSGYFFKAQNLLNILRQVCVSSIIGVGFTLILASGNIDLSVGYLLGMLGVIMGKLSKVQGVPFWAVLLAGLLVGIFCETMNGVIITYLKLPSFVVTLATAQVFRGICYIVSNTTTIAGLNEGFRYIGQAYFAGIPVPVYIMLVVAFIVWLIFTRMIIGRYIVAMGGNEEAARVSGINTNSVRIFVYFMMGICTAIAAMVLTGRALSAQPNAGAGMEMDAIAAVVIGGTPLSGGIGRIGGTIFGCLIVGVINNILNLCGVDSNWQLVAKGVMILCAILLDTQTGRIMAKRSKG